MKAEVFLSSIYPVHTYRSIAITSALAMSPAENMLLPLRPEPVFSSGKSPLADRRNAKNRLGILRANMPCGSRNIFISTPSTVVTVSSSLPALAMAGKRRELIPVAAAAVVTIPNASLRLIGGWSPLLWCANNDKGEGLVVDRLGVVVVSRASNNAQHSLISKSITATISSRELSEGFGNILDIEYLSLLLLFPIFVSDWWWWLYYISDVFPSKGCVRVLAKLRSKCCEV